MAEPVVVHIQPIDHPPTTYLVYHGPTLLAGPTTTPYIAAATQLLAQGYDSSRWLLMRRRGVDVNQLAYTISYAAQLGAEYEAQPPPLGRQDVGSSE